METGEDAELGIDAEDQRMLLRFYASKLQAICTELRLPLKVRGTAVAYLARYFLSCSVLDMHPGTIFLTCLYLACKVRPGWSAGGAAGFGEMAAPPDQLLDLWGTANAPEPRPCLMGSRESVTGVFRLVFHVQVTMRGPHGP